LRKLALVATLFAFPLLASLASAQQADVALGFGTIMSPGASACAYSASAGQVLCPEKGGIYPSVSADVIFHRRIGFSYDVLWRGGQGLGGQPYRPIINDFDAIFQPRLGKKLGVDLDAGIGIQSTRAYGFSYSSSCIYFYACYTSAHHFLVNFGGGLRYYFWHHVFIRPEVRYYWVNNNSDTSGSSLGSTPNLGFTSGNLLRVGASVGYTLGGD
jgi:hypothetical protein